MPDAPWSLLGAIAMALAVALGAFGAHGLKKRVAADRLLIWETAVRYHLAHALGLFAVDGVRLMGGPVHQASSGALALAGWLILAGLVLFSGSLYALTLSGKRWLGAVTPIGGLAWIAAWIALATAVPVS